MHQPGFERVFAVTAGALLLAAPIGVGVISLLGRAIGLDVSPSWSAGGLVALGVGLGAIGVGGHGPLARHAKRLPAWLDGERTRRPVVAILFALLAIVAVAQSVRLSVYMADPEARWGASVEIHHACMAAYVQAADLARRGDANVYAAEHYPAFVTRRHGGESPVRNLGPWISDPYQYPPHFLLLPAAALALSNDFHVHRTAWFVLRFALILGVAFMLAHWLGGRRGYVAAALVFLLASFPFTIDLQHGQAHVATVALALAAMFAFTYARDTLGGALLAMSILTKIFPGLLVVYLALRGRWRAVVATAAWGVAFTLLGLLVLGPAPFVAFFEYHLPRLASGEAFAFQEVDPAIFALIWSVPSLIRRLDLLGVPGMGDGIVRALSVGYLLILVGLVAIAARRGWPSRTEPMVWLAILFLGSLQSAAVFFSYAPVPVLWLLACLSGEARTRMQIAGVAALWVLIIGGPPLGTLDADLVKGFVSQGVAMSVAFWAALRTPVEE